MTTNIVRQEGWTPSNTYAARLVTLRRELDLTVEEISQQCGIASATWGNWENGTRPQDFIGAVERICKGTGVSREWLAWGTSSPWYPGTLAA
jgi:transcriptional regulator with XRE-family HTH domain